jgi:hypothetical protein
MRFQVLAGGDIIIGRASQIRRMGKPVKIVPLCANVSCQIEILLERFPDGLRGPVFAALLD